uniref:maturase K n=1 Tax=Juncus bufonius TaxID=223656 RepID=UPI001F138D7C|nr:maturase K [Juncus bufonius]ULQ66598.1 maturase K [Juncus bufonius]
MSMENFQGYLEKYEFCQDQCLYPLLFQEYIYALAYDYGLNACLFSQSVEELISYDNKYSSILVKRLITRMYQQNYLINSVNRSKFKSFLENDHFFYSHFYSQMISEGFGVILEIPFALELLSFSRRKKRLKLQNLRSIHSIFSFFEDKLLHFHFMSDILIPYPIHFEILIQILQHWIQDVPFLHLLRFFLFEYLNCDSLITSKNWLSIFSKENQRLFRLLYNSYIYEYEFVFLFLYKKSSYLRFISFGIFLERMSFYGKIKHFRIVYLTSLQKILWFFADSFIHYVRYQGKAILSSRGTFLLMKKWQFYLVSFWQYYFHFWFQPNRIFINQLCNYSFYFFGYLLSLKKNHLVVRGQILENSVLINTMNNQLDTIVPVIPLIRSLSIATFCTVSGHPISKPIWADLSDRDILTRFGQISRNLFHYYSGSSKKCSLYRIKFILRLSCARTLARKHKSTVRTFMQKLGAMFLEEFFTEEEQVLSLVFQKTIHFSLHRSNRERIWYLDIIRINDLVNYFELWS